MTLQDAALPLTCSAKPAPEEDQDDQQYRRKDSEYDDSPQGSSAYHDQRCKEKKGDKRTHDKRTCPQASTCRFPYITISSARCRARGSWAGSWCSSEK